MADITDVMPVTQGNADKLVKPTLLKEIEEIDRALGKMVTDYQSYRTMLLSTFAVSFAIPLSPITAQISHLASHWWLAMIVFALWAFGVGLMVNAFHILMEKIDVREQLETALSRFDMRLANAWDDQSEMKESRDRALEQMRKGREELEDKLNRLTRGRRIVLAALILFMLCVGIEFFSFLLCKALGL